MAQYNNEAKEIRLFGDKSIREEAYREKILQLERELARLEAIAKEVAPVDANNFKTENHAVHLEGLYHESLLSFDKRVKREQELIEKRAMEITERLNTHAQHLILNIESSFRQKIRWVAVLLFVGMGLLLPLLIIVTLFYKINVGGLSPKVVDRNNTAGYETRVLADRINYIKRALETQTVYHNLYEVSYIDYLNSTYVIEIELNFQPTDRWFLKTLSQDLISLFQKYVVKIPADFSFTYKGKLYAKAYLSDMPARVHFQYF